MANIPIGTVAPVNENQLFNDGQVQVTPAADLRHFDVAQILTNDQVRDVYLGRQAA